MKLFSCVVEHDDGIAPCPDNGYCTLVRCKFSRSGKPNLVESAQVGDWIMGTGGANTKASAGNGKIIYAMRVDEKLPLSDYNQDKRFRTRRDIDDRNESQRFALISQHFYYFGRNAIEIERLPLQEWNHSLEKQGPGYRNKFDATFVETLIEWLQSHHEVGVHGKPCGASNHCEPFDEDEFCP